MATTYRVEMILDEDDYDAFQAEVARRQAGLRWPADDGRTGPILPDGESDLLGGIVGEMVRDLDDYRAMFDARHPPE